MKAAARLAALAISQRGFCVCHGGLGASVIADAAREVGALFQRGAMRPGGFTVGGRDDVVSAKRDDHTLWLHEYLDEVGGPVRGDAETLLALDHALAQFGEAVVNALSALDRPHEVFGRRRADGSRLHYTGRTDLMVACYPSNGAHYGPHVDNVDGDGREHLDDGRVLTLTFYLNPSWDARSGGGALRVHLPPRGDSHRGVAEGAVGTAEAATDAASAAAGAAASATSGRTQSSISSLLHAAHDVVDVPPHGDTFVVFRADQVRPCHLMPYARRNASWQAWTDARCFLVSARRMAAFLTHSTRLIQVLHEVRPAYGQRLAATVWFYGGNASQGANARSALAQATR